MTKSQTFVPIVLQQKKMKRTSSHSSLSTVQNSKQLHSQKNRKISQTVKTEFIQMVTKKNFSMKNAAKETGISYSTAKKIFTSFRQTLQNKSNHIISSDTSSMNLQRTIFSPIKVNSGKGLQIISLIGGSAQEQKKMEINIQ